MRENKKILIQRPEYLKKLENRLGQEDLVKIASGARRCGKSILFVLFQDLLINKYKVKKEQIININLEDTLQTRKIGIKYNNKNMLEGYENLIDFILEKLDAKKMNYVFIDEIQMLEHWQRAANTLRLQKNIDLYLTGSNAYMFSGDLSNTFGGRFIEIKMLPFSFKEYYEACKIKKTDFDLHDVYESYIKKSGFPQTINFSDNEDLISDYLMNTVYLNTLYKDIIKRYNIADTNKLDAVIRYVFDNIGCETSLNNISKCLKAAGSSVSAPALDNYLQGLLDSYLIYKCDRYDIKGRKYLEGNAKYYIVDAGLRAALLGASDRDFGHILENVVYLELLRRGYQISSGRITSKTVKNNGIDERKNIEVDFIVKKNNLTEYYQVSLNALAPETLERAIRPLEEIKDNHPKYLLTMESGSGETGGIKRLNVLKWLLDSESIA